MNNINTVARYLRARGLAVTEHPGWLRLPSGRFTPRGILYHHTASRAPVRDLSTLTRADAAPSLRAVLETGNGTTPPPLCQILLGRDRHVHLITSGRANHAGRGGPLKDTESGAIIVPAGRGNEHLIGLEVENNGTGEPWAPELIEAADLVIAVLCRHLNIPPTRIWGHKEWAPTRKIDPAGIVMDHVRARVAALLAPPPAHPPTGEPMAPTTPAAPGWSINDLAPTLDNVEAIYRVAHADGFNPADDDGWGPIVFDLLRRGQDPTPTLEFIAWALHNPAEAAELR